MAEKTGYPAEMLRLEMELESDLGIDSIKRVEILAALQERVPGLPEVKAAELAALRTLGHIVARMGVQKAAAQTDAPAASTKCGSDSAGLTPAVSRFGLRAIAAPPLGFSVRGLADGRTVFLTGDDGTFSEALAAELLAHGVPSRRAPSPEVAEQKLVDNPPLDVLVHLRFTRTTRRVKTGVDLFKRQNLIVHARHGRSRLLLGLAADQNQHGNSGTNTVSTKLHAWF